MGETQTEDRPPQITKKDEAGMNDPIHGAKGRAYHPVQSIRELDSGDIVRHRGSGTVYVVTANNGHSATAVKTIDISNAPEWEVLRAAAPDKT